MRVHIVRHRVKPSKVCYALTNSFLHVSVIHVRMANRIQIKYTYLKAHTHTDSCHRQLHTIDMNDVVNEAQKENGQYEAIIMPFTGKSITEIATLKLAEFPKPRYCYN